VTGRMVLEFSDWKTFYSVCSYIVLEVEGISGIWSLPVHVHHLFGIDSLLRRFVVCLTFEG
jgi:hypothetical protein